MPFIGRDWRSPGEAWVKTESLGWQRMKIIESQLFPTCHQNPACSWPPKSEFGQHMAKHCMQQKQNNSQSRNDSLSSAGSDSDSISNSSGTSSRAGSTSPSPTCTPEKSIHHPITVSSPYGQYSCCAHHLESNHLPLSSIRGCGLSERNKSSAQNRIINSRSLSKESIKFKELTSSSSPPKSLKLRYNHSDIDLRNSSTTNNTRLDFFDQSSRASQPKNECDQSKDCFNISSAKHLQNSDPVLRQNVRSLEPNQLIKNDEELEQNRSENKKEQSMTMLDCGTKCCCFSLDSQGPQSALQKQQDSHLRQAPHCRISVRTREVAMYNTISEACYRLDFCNAIHDIRRFNYICKLLHLLITQNLTSLSGCATRVLFTMLEQVAWEVSSNKRNIHILKNLLNELRQMLQKYYCWGRPIGSSLLWQQHFDTIERISHMVDEIELSPPNDENDDQITFNSLPVEMIREILLRLNDYRDLVNSAQASPVMRSMINGQYIWRQLCRYHFTEQQLKSALENYNRLPPKKIGNTTRGTKYAKTTSPDGKTSFRNPILHKSKPNHQSRSSQVSRQESDKNDAIHQSESIDSRQTRNEENKRPCSSNSSYVTRAIKIFDKEGASNRAIGKEDGGRTERPPIKVNQQAEKPVPSTSGQNLRRTNSKKDQVLTTATGSSRSMNSNRLNQDIDWERVFHHLRKKFDLKEEYPDCLLLCRHCRCLFWKSFGHPCIKNDDKDYNRDNSGRKTGIRVDKQNCSLMTDQLQSTTRCGRNVLGQINRTVNQPQDSNNFFQANGEANQMTDTGRLRRPSVATLSRSFNNRAVGLHGADEGPSGSGTPEMSQENQVGSCSSGSSSDGRSNTINNNVAGLLDEQSSNNSNLNYQLRNNINIRLGNRRRNNEDNNSSLSAADNRRRNQLSFEDDPSRSGPNAIGPLRRKESLVPEHVAISPQAFLKFFSL